MQSSKRRKVDHASSTLTKPFRSPVKRNADTISSDRDIEHGAAQPTTTAASDTSNRVTPEQMPSSEDLHATSGDPDVLQKEYTMLSKRLTVLRQSLDTAEQALHIESTDQKGKINALIRKWRDVARECAEEVFDGSKDRVAMEGTNNETPGRGSSWQDDETTLLSEEQKECLNQQKEEDEELARKYNLIEPDQTEEDSEQVSIVAEGKDPLIHFAEIYDDHYAATNEH